LSKKNRTSILYYNTTLSIKESEKEKYQALSVEDGTKLLQELANILKKDKSFLKKESPSKTVHISYRVYKTPENKELLDYVKEELKERNSSLSEAFREI
jgi:hypothetical protein